MTTTISTCVNTLSTQSDEDTLEYEIKRTLLFAICILTRTFIMLTAKYKCREEIVQHVLCFFGLAVAIGLITLWLTGRRKTGWETQGRIIWWNWLRPIHAVLWGLFAVQIYRKCDTAWRILAADLWLAAFARHLTDFLAGYNVFD